MHPAAQNRKPSKRRRAIKEAAIFLTAGVLLSIAVAWGCAAFISILPTPFVIRDLYVRQSADVRPSDAVLPFRLYNDPFGSAMPTPSPAHPIDPAHNWFWDPESMGVYLRHLSAERPGAKRRTTEILAFQNDYGFALPVYHPEDKDSGIVDGLYSIVSARYRPLSGSEWLPTTISINLPAAIIATGTPAARNAIWPADVDAYADDYFTQNDYINIDMIREAGRRIPAEEDARGWPFLCLFSRIHEHRTDALAIAGRPVTGGIKLPPRITPLCPSNTPIPAHLPASIRYITEARALPLLPIWPGLILNTLIYAAALWLLTLGPIRLRRALRHRKGHCRQCGYDLNNLTADRCPECGVATPIR